MSLDISGFLWTEAAQGQQPLGLMAIDWSDPLTRGLVAVNESISRRNLVTGAPLQLTGTINTAAVPGGGVAVSSPTIAGSNVLIAPIAALGASDATTVVVVYNPALIADSNNHFIAGSYRGGSLTCAMQINTVTTHYWSVLTGNGSTVTTSSNEVLPVGLHVLVHTQIAGTHTLYRNGVQKNSAAHPNGNSNNTFCICDVDSSAIANATNRPVLLGIKFSRGLSPQEVAQISANPWRFLPQASPISLPAHTAGAGVSYSLSGLAGSYAYTGKPATVARAIKLAGSAGAYSYNGIAATATYTPGSSSHPYALSGNAGAYVYTGVAATVARSIKLSGASGSYSYTGIAAQETVGRKLAGLSGSYSYAGKPAVAVLGHNLAGSSGSYAYAGPPATLTYTTTGPTAYTLSGAAGAYAITGHSATLVVPGSSGAGGGMYARKVPKHLRIIRATVADEPVEAETVEALTEQVERIAKQDAAKPDASFPTIKAAKNTYALQMAYLKSYAEEALKRANEQALMHVEIKRLMMESDDEDAVMALLL